MADADARERKAARERQSHVRHELRAPLAVMYPALSLLLDGSAGDLTPKQRDYLEILERNAVRMERRLAGATESGWLDCAGAVAEPAAVSLGEVLEEVLALRRFGGQHEPPLEVEHDTGPRAIAWADREQVRQIVGNLLRNATQSCGGGGAVRITMGTSADRLSVSLAVHDDGPGIPSDELPHVFDFGFRGAAAQDASTQGLGIGLWVCRELVGRSGGSIAIHSEVGAGTTVTVTFPTAPSGSAR
jgi:two-component system, OmpR family, phosphate regulon sensor histidine kinase PhoR